MTDPQRGEPAEEAGAAGRSDRKTPRGRGQTDLARHAGLGLQIAATMAVFVIGGNWLDERLGTDPWLTLLGAVLAFVSILVFLIRIARGER